MVKDPAPPPQPDAVRRGEGGNLVPLRPGSLDFQGLQMLKLNLKDSGCPQAGRPHPPLACLLFSTLSSPPWGEIFTQSRRQIG